MVIGEVGLQTMLLELGQPVLSLRGIGSSREQLLAESGILTVADLLLYLPYKYLDRSRETGIAELPEGQEVTAIGWGRSAATLPGKRQRFVLVLEDDSGELERKRLCCTSQKPNETK